MWMFFPNFVALSDKVNFTSMPLMTGITSNSFTSDLLLIYVCFWPKLSVCVTTMQKSRNITGQNRSPIFWYVVLIMHKKHSSHPFWQKGLGWQCPVRSVLKRTPEQDLNSFSIMFCCIISTACQKIGDLFCPVIFLDFRTVCIF